MTDRLVRSRILIVDDHPIVREGLAMRISAQHDLEVCGEAATEDETLALVKQVGPDLLIVDISLKNGHGLELVKQVKARHPAVKMLVLSGFQESLYGERALRAGALGYLNKQESNEKVLEAIRTVLKGERFVSPELTRRLVVQALDGRNVASNPIELLSDRELEIFRSGRLLLSTHTIDTHRENIKRKLGAKNAGELNRQVVQWVLENG